MQKWKEDFMSFVNNKVYILMLSLTALFGYGFMITHQTVGIDDTPYTFYFEDGLNVIIGRWFLYLLNKVFHVADFSPFITELAGVLILMLAVTVWCTLVYSVCRERIPMWGYVFFGCIFLSCPLISEVYTYYLHNGISVGYLCTGVSVCCFKEFAACVSKHKRGETIPWKRLLWVGLASAFFLFVALGCYESFMIVWLVGVLMTLFLTRSMEQSGKVFRCLLAGAVIAVIAILIRSIMINACIVIFDLSALEDAAIQRSVVGKLGWLFGEEAGAEFSMAIKRTFVMYIVFAYAYYPIKVFVWASIVILLFAVWHSVQKRDLWIGVLAIGIFFASFLLVVIEGNATLYRAAQFLPLICGLGALLVAGVVGYMKKARFYRGVSGVMIFVLSAILWNQCYDMNQWFYADWLKYEVAKDAMIQVAQELQANYDTSKPIVFTGVYQVPKSVIENAYVDYGTETYYKMKRLTDFVDETLLDKYNRAHYGVWVAQTPALSVIEWGGNAFGTNTELVHFLEMHGYALRGNEDAELFEEMQAKTVDFPSFPAAGSIVDMGECIVVHF